MHEYSIVQALIERVDTEARARGATGVRRVRVRIGELAGIEPGLLATAYDTFRARTCCQAATLEIDTVSASWACPRCGEPIAPGAVLRCPRCAQPAELRGGDEIVLAQIEMEVP